MTDEQKLAHLLKVLKDYAELKHCYDEEGGDYTPSHGSHDAVFDDGRDYGEILFARDLLKAIGADLVRMSSLEEEEYSDPCPECGEELKHAPGGGVKCSCGYWFCY
jgi:hypothetical protein